MSVFDKHYSHSHYFTFTPEVKAKTLLCYESDWISHI